MRWMDYGFRNGSLRQVVPVVSCGGVPRLSRHSMSRSSQVVADDFVVSTGFGASCLRPVECFFPFPVVMVSLSCHRPLRPRSS